MHNFIFLVILIADIEKKDCFLYEVDRLIERLYAKFHLIFKAVGGGNEFFKYMYAIFLR